MKHKAYLLVIFVGMILIVGVGIHQSVNAGTLLAPLSTLGTAFTYQGRLMDGNSPAEGTYDLRFRLYDDPDSGEGNLAGTVMVSNQSVSEGLFSVALDFGEVFDGTAYWLEVAVRPGDSDGVYVTLDQRQPITAAPYALYARSIPLSGSGSAVTAARSDHDHNDIYYTQTELQTSGLAIVNWGNLTDLPPGFADGVDHTGEVYANLVTVAKSGGDYNSVQAAIDSISDASASNPYLVWVAPGLYEEAVTMKPHVHLQGAGQEATIVSSEVSDENHPTKATLVLSEHTSLRDLSLVNQGTGDYKTALLASSGASEVLVANVNARVQASGSHNYTIFIDGSGTQVTLKAVSALAENGDYNIGLFTNDSASTTLWGGSFTARGGEIARGIYNSISSLEAFDVIALGEISSWINIGIENYDGLAILRGGTFSARGGEYTNGIYNYYATTPEALLETFEVIAMGENGSKENYGLYNYYSVTARLHGGSFTGRGGPTARGIYNASSSLEAESVVSIGMDASGTVSFNQGLYNFEGSAILRGGSFIGDEGANIARGIINAGDDSYLEISNCTVEAKIATTESYGLRTANNSTTMVFNSALEGVNNSVYRDGGSVTISNSRLTGSVFGTVTCVAVSEGVIFYQNTCP